MSGIILILAAIWLSSPAVSRSVLPPVPPSPAECQNILTTFAGDSNDLKELYNPLINSVKDLGSLQSRYDMLQTCLPASYGFVENESMQALNLSIEYFKVFTGVENADGQNSRLELVDLAKSRDPAVIILRDQIGLPAPRGLVFIRYYPDRESLPEVLKTAFKDPEVAGVTIFSKYIAVIDENKKSWYEKILNQKVLPGIVSHELVHAYVNGLTLEDEDGEANSFPRWFNEGLATYISKSGAPHSVTLPGVTITQTPTEDYLDYLLVFQFLESKVGQFALYENIKRAVIDRDLNSLYELAGAPDDIWLQEMARSWKAGTIRDRAVIGVVAISLLVVGVFIVLPEYQCECGFSGRKNDFIGARCPVCSREISISRRHLTYRLPIQPYLDCQVCHRGFWLWQQGELQRHNRWISVWSPNPTGAQEPIIRYVNRVCRNCSSISETIEGDYPFPSYEFSDEFGSGEAQGSNFYDAGEPTHVEHQSIDDQEGETKLN